MDWYIRRMEPPDEKAFLAFLERMMRPETRRIPVLSHYRWLYRENPHGAALTWLVLERGSDDVVGCVSQFPRKMWVQDRVMQASIGGDMWVDPRFRRQGIATKLQAVLAREMRGAGLEFRLSLPAPAMMRIKRRTGSTLVGSIRKAHFLLRSDPVIEGLLSGRGPRATLSRLGDRLLRLYIDGKLSKVAPQGGEIKPISRFDDRYDALLQAVLPSFGVCSVRDSAYLNWRHFDNPVETLTILGYEEGDDVHGFAALELAGHTGYLVDLFARREDAFVDELMGGVIRFAQERGLDRITSLLNPDGPYARNFRHLGFRLDWMQIPVPIALPEDADGMEDLIRLEDWYLTFSDYDMESMAPLVAAMG